MEAGKDWGNREVGIYGWVRFQGLPPEAGGLAPQGLDPGHHQLFPTEARNSITASNFRFETVLSYNAKGTGKMTL